MNLATPDPVYVLEIAGTFVFAISGVSAAAEKKFDLFGVMFIAFVTAIGGGTLRDTMIGLQPVGWLRDENIIFTIGMAVILGFFFLRYILALRRTLFLFDTLGLALFTILGIERTLGAELSPMAALLMGTISAVFGGVLRDLLCGHSPLIFSGALYATHTIIGGLLYLLLMHLGLVQELSMIVVLSVIISLRVLSVRYKWTLPSIR